jgi:hypothetical protein
MRRVYASASANIAATSATGSTVGLDFERYPLAVAPFAIRMGNIPYLLFREFPISCYADTECDDLADGVLNSWGWVAQGKLPLLILYFYGPLLKFPMQLVHLFLEHTFRVGNAFKSNQRSWPGANLIFASLMLLLMCSLCIREPLLTACLCHTRSAVYQPGS